MFIGQQKGRNTKENIMRNFGMPTPHGYVYMEVTWLSLCSVYYDLNVGCYW